MIGTKHRWEINIKRNNTLKRNHLTKLRVFVTGVILALTLPACVQVQIPDKPITINLNHNITAEVLVKVEKELDEIMSDDSGLF